MRAIRSFPWHLLPRVRKCDTIMLRAMRGTFAREQAALLRALESLTSEECTLHLGKSWTPQDGILSASDPGKPAGLVLRSGHLSWVIEEALGALLLSKVLRVEAGITDRTREPSSAFLGGIAAIAEFLARSTSLGSVRFAPGSLPREHSLFLSFSLQLGGRGYVVWCAANPIEPTLSRELGPPARSSGRGHDLPISIPLVVATLAFSGQEFSALAKGDAILLGRGGQLREGHLSPAGVEWGWPVQIEREADLRIKVVLGKKRGDLPFMPGDTTLSDLALEAPVLVRVELGSVELQARAWNELNAGDTVALGIGLGNPVTLRVGTKVVARGELVDIEGELGVRLLERID